MIYLYPIYLYAIETRELTTLETLPYLYAGHMGYIHEIMLESDTRAIEASSVERRSRHRGYERGLYPTGKGRPRAWTGVNMREIREREISENPPKRGPN